MLFFKFFSMNTTQRLYRLEKQFTPPEETSEKEMKIDTREETGKLFEPTFRNATQRAEKE